MLLPSLNNIPPNETKDLYKQNIEFFINFEVIIQELYINRNKSQITASNLIEKTFDFTAQPFKAESLIQSLEIMYITFIRRILLHYHYET